MEVVKSKEETVLKDEKQLILDDAKNQNVENQSVQQSIDTVLEITKPVEVEKLNEDKIIKKIRRESSTAAGKAAANLKIIKLSARAKALINASITTAKARATNFVNTAEGLRPADSVKEKEEKKGNFLIH